MASSTSDYKKILELILHSVIFDCWVQDLVEDEEQHGECQVWGMSCAVFIICILVLVQVSLRRLPVFMYCNTGSVTSVRSKPVYEGDDRGGRREGEERGEGGCCIWVFLKGEGMCGGYDFFTRWLLTLQAKCSKQILSSVGYEDRCWGCVFEAVYDG